MTTETTTPDTRTPQRVRHPLKFRHLTVASVEDLSAQLRRVVLEGKDLAGFTSLGFDDHVKLILPLDGKMVLPTLGEEGPVWPEPRPPMRDYTPRHYDAEAGRLTIDFAIGHGGPATDWAEGVAVGDDLGIGGPRGSMVVSTDYADHLLIGDEAALPAMARRLEELPAGVRAHVVAEIEQEGEELTLTSQADLRVTWVYRKGEGRGEGRALTEAALAVAAEIDPADAYVWAACEAKVARALRPQLLAANRFNPKWMKVAGYWRLGEEGRHEVIED